MKKRGAIIKDAADSVGADIYSAGTSDGVNPGMRNNILQLRHEATGLRR